MGNTKSKLQYHSQVKVGKCTTSDPIKPGYHRTITVCYKLSKNGKSAARQKQQKKRVSREREAVPMPLLEKLMTLTEKYMVNIGYKFL